MNRRFLYLLTTLILLFLITSCKKNDDPVSSTDQNQNTQNNFWKKLAVPSLVNSAAIDNSGAIWAATTDGVYKSSDNGSSWTKIITGLASVNSPLIKTSSNGNVFVYAGTSLYIYLNNSWSDISKNINTTLITFKHLYTFSVDKSGNIYAACLISEKLDASTIGMDTPSFFKSSDAGKTWTKIKVQVAEGQIKDVLIDAKGYFYVIEDGTIFHSTDAGKTFVKAASGIGSANPFVLTSNSTGIIFSGTGSGLLKSTDSGVSWSNANWTTYCVSAGINSKDILFVGAINKCWKSTNNGTNWIEVSSGLSYSLSGFTDCKIQGFDSNGFAYAILESVLYVSTSTTL